MIKSLLYLLVTTVGFAACTGSSPTWTSTPDRTSVASCISSASRNDTINVSSGSATWSSSIMITKGLTVTGAGVGNTVITASDIIFDIEPDSTAIANEEMIKVTGFTLDGNNAALNLMQVTGSPANGTKPFKKLVIGNNKFQNTSTVTSGSGAITLGWGQIRGVIYSNTFDRCNVIIKAMGADDTTESDNTAYSQIAYGSADNLYFEDNTILYSSSSSAADPGWIETGQGGRLVGRYNTWNLTNATHPQEVWDIHGFQNWDGTPNSGQTGTMIVEYYGNTLTNMGVYRWINHRGGWGLFFDNILTGTGGGNNVYGMSAGAACASDISPTPTNYNPLVTNSYFFNNTSGGSEDPVTDGGGIAYMSCTPAENSNWWNYNASCTASSCSAGVGRGISAPTGSCTTGTAYWVASTATPTANSTVIQSGTLYKCTATNTWTAYYQPYTYPHPLRGSPPSETPSASLQGDIRIIGTSTMK